MRAYCPPEMEINEAIEKAKVSLRKERNKRAQERDAERNRESREQTRTERARN